jgi:hypothetical protein
VEAAIPQSATADMTAVIWERRLPPHVRLSPIACRPSLLRGPDSLSRRRKPARHLALGIAELPEAERVLPPRHLPRRAAAARYTGVRDTRSRAPHLGGVCGALRGVSGGFPSIPNRPAAGQPAGRARLCLGTCRRRSPGLGPRRAFVSTVVRQAARRSLRTESL